MKKIHSLDLHGVTVDDILNEFNTRHDEFGIGKKSDLISINVRPDTKPQKISVNGGDAQDSEVVVTFLY